jgi:hypothetical protein
MVTVGIAAPLGPPPFFKKAVDSTRAASGDWYSNLGDGALALKTPQRPEVERLAHVGR